LRRITIFDTTLRDGEQSPGIALVPDAKAEIGLALDRLGVDVIEAGFAASSLGEAEGVRAVAESVPRATVACMARASEGDVLAAADALLVNERATVIDMSLPSKLTSYFAAGRPVIGALADSSETGRELVAAGAGVLVEPDDPQALADAVAATAGDLEAARAYGDNARRYAADHLSIAAVMKAYDDLLDTVAERA
jgi:isopropylmalate/homocitrate/citramalate synthase